MWDLVVAVVVVVITTALTIANFCFSKSVSPEPDIICIGRWDEVKGGTA